MPCDDRWRSKTLPIQLDELKYEYPEELGGESGDTHAELERLAWEGAKIDLGQAMLRLCLKKFASKSIMSAHWCVGLTMPPTF